MKDRSSNRDHSESTQAGKNNTGHGAEKDAGRFTGDGAGERGYRGRSAPDTPPGSVPGGSYGAGGGHQQGDLGGSDASAEGDATGSNTADKASGSDSGDRASAEDEEEDLWRDAYGAYGFSRGDEFVAYPAEVVRPSGDRAGVSGYGAQGFGVGEQRGSQWGGGARGGYGGGLPGRDSADPNDPRATRGRAWGERGQPRREST